MPVPVLVLVPVPVLVLVAVAAANACERASAAPPPPPKAAMDESAARSHRGVAACALTRNAGRPVRSAAERALRRDKAEEDDTDAASSLGGENERCSDGDATIDAPEADADTVSSSSCNAGECECECDCCCSLCCACFSARRWRRNSAPRARSSTASVAARISSGARRRRADGGGNDALPSFAEEALAVAAHVTSADDAPPFGDDSVDAAALLTRLAGELSVESASPKSRAKRPPRGENARDCEFACSKQI